MLDVTLYQNSEGIKYLILNTWQRVALSYEYCQIFGETATGNVNKVYEEEGNAWVENGVLKIHENTRDLGTDGIRNSTSVEYDAEIFNGEVRKI